MKISLLEPLGVSKEEIAALARGLRDRGHEFVAYDEKTTDLQELIRRSRDSDIVMIANNPYPEEAVRGAEKLKMLAVAFTGVDHVGLQACREKRVTVCNASGYSTETVAELTVGMAVDALRRVLYADQAARRGGTSAGIGGGEICGRTVGIVGLGKIGLRAAELFQAFGARVIAFSRRVNPEAEKRGIAYLPLEDVLKQSDILSVHLPLNEATRGLIGREQIALMKKTAVLINCARGPIVDQQALADALNEDRLAFACVDVFDREPPLDADTPLLHAKNTLLTPHIAFISAESMQRRARIVFDNVYAFLDGKPQNVVG